MKTLHLILKKKWYDLLRSGKKNVDYREFKGHWVSRLRDHNGEYKEFDSVTCRHGYTTNTKTFKREFLGVDIIHSSAHEPENGEKLDGLYFRIKMGKLIKESKQNV